MTSLEPTIECECKLEEPFALESGGRLQPVVIRYAVYGQLNAQRSNAILACHALSGSARVADWWGEMFAPGQPFDPVQHCLIGINVLGSCYGSSGPQSINPHTGQAYGPDFPLVSIRDMVRAQAVLLDRLGIERLHAVIGGSIGGMQSLQWAIDFPQRVEHCVAIGATPLSAMGLALNHLQRRAIELDPHWQQGRYSDQQPPAGGLALARAVAMCSYKSSELFCERYGRKPNRTGEDPNTSMNGRFDVAGYLDYQGDSFTRRFDANTYLVLSRAMDLFDLQRGYQSEEHALRRIRAKMLLIGISSDWLFPANDVRELARRMRTAGVNCVYRELVSQHGHDAFLAHVHLLAPVVAEVLGGGKANPQTVPLTA